MNTHIRLVSSEDGEEAIGLDEPVVDTAEASSGPPSVGGEPSGDWPNPIAADPSPQPPSDPETSAKALAWAAERTSVLTAQFEREQAEEAALSASDAARPPPSENREEGPLALPEEGGSLKADGLKEENFKDEILGETPPPLVAELEDRAAGPLDGGEAGKTRGARWLGFLWPAKPKAPPPAGGEDKGGEREEIEASEPPRPQGSDDRAGGTGADDAARLEGMGEREAAADSSPASTPAPAKSRGPRMKIARAAALAAGVAVAAIVVATWPHGPPPSPVEPGMLADGKTKLIAPSAALATAPPREVANVPHDRPVVHETRRDALEEVLAFKEERSAPGLTLAAPAPPQPAREVKSPETEHPAIAPEEPVGPAYETAMNTPPSPKSMPAPGTDKAKAGEAEPAPAVVTIREPGMGAPPPAAVARAAPSVHPAPPSAVPAPKEGNADAAKIEARLAALETAVKDRSNEGRARVEAEMAETHTLEKIAELGALVTRLTGQVNDLQDQVQTVSAGSEVKFADLTRRVALGEANRAVAGCDSNRCRVGLG